MQIWPKSTKNKKKHVKFDLYRVKSYQTFSPLLYTR